MEQQKIQNSLNEANDSKFVTRKQNIGQDRLKSNYDATNEMTCNTEILISFLCDYTDAYILVREDITVLAAPATQVVFMICPLFSKCIIKNYETTIDDAEDLDLVMPMYNLIGQSSNYSESMGTFQFYSKDETTNFNADIINDNNFKSFKYNANLLEKAAAQADPNNANGILKIPQFLCSENIYVIS